MWQLLPTDVIKLSNNSSYLHFGYMYLKQQVLCKSKIITYLLTISWCYENFISPPTLQIFSNEKIPVRPAYVQRGFLASFISTILILLHMINLHSVHSSTSSMFPNWFIHPYTAIAWHSASLLCETATVPTLGPSGRQLA